MRVTRISVADDGASRFDELELPLREFDFGMASHIVPATGFAEISFSSGALPFHPAPRRQLVVVLEGSMEIDSGTEIRQFGPGEVLLADDTSGIGHALKRDVDLRLLAVVLPPDLSLDTWTLGQTPLTKPDQPRTA